MSHQVPPDRAGGDGSQAPILVRRRHMSAAIRRRSAAPKPVIAPTFTLTP